MKKSTLNTCHLALNLMLDDKENRLKNIETMLLIATDEEQKAQLEEFKQYYKQAMDEINEAIEDVKAEEIKILYNERKRERKKGEKKIDN